MPFEPILAIASDVLPFASATFSGPAPASRWRWRRDAQAKARAGAAAGAFRVLTLTRREDIAGLEREWNDLAARCTAPLNFQSFAAAMAFADEAAWKPELRIVSVRDAKGRLEAVLPLQICTQAGLRVAEWLGDPIVQYGDAVAAPGRSRALGAALEAVATWRDVDAVLLRRVRRDAAITPLLRERAAASGRTEAPFLDLSRFCDLEGFRDGMSGHARNRRRADRRKLAALGEISFQAERGGAAGPLFDRAVSLKQRWLAERGLVGGPLFDAAGVATLRRLVVEPASGGVVSALSVGDRIAAIEVGLACNGHYCAYLGAIDEAFSRFSPGKLQMEETIGWCIGQGLSRYDLLAPADAYKAGWTDTSVAVCDYTIPLSLRGFMLPIYQKHVRPRLKEARDRLPHPLRRLAARLIGQRGG